MPCAVLEHFCPLFIQIAQMVLILPRWGLILPRIPPPTPVLYSAVTHSFQLYVLTRNTPNPTPKHPFSWPDFESGQNELLSGQNGPHLGKMFEKWAKRFEKWAKKKLFMEYQSETGISKQVLLQIQTEPIQAPNFESHAALDFCTAIVSVGLIRATTPGSLDVLH